MFLFATAEPANALAGRCDVQRQKENESSPATHSHPFSLTSALSFSITPTAMTSEHPRIVSDSGTNTPAAPDMGRRTTGAGGGGGSVGGSSGTFSVKTGLAQVRRTQIEQLVRGQVEQERAGQRKLLGMVCFFSIGARWADRFPFLPFPAFHSDGTPFLSTSFESQEADG